MGVWEKFQLGWLGCDACPGGRFYDVGFATQRSEHKLGPAEFASKQAQGLFVVLPEKQKDTVVGTPATGDFFYWSGADDDLNNTMTKEYTLPAGASLTADVSYDIEEDFDYAFLEVSDDDGATWDPVLTNRSDTDVSTDQSGFNASGTGITGVSGGYVQLTADLSAWTGDVLIRFRYQTDGGLTRPGFLVDNIAVTGSDVDGAEAEQSGWEFDGFKRTSGTATTFHFNAYVAENRGYRGYDESLQFAYNFGFLDSRPDWVETHPYEDGLLISYWDESFNDNSVGDHPGGGLVLPIDAHPQFGHSYDGHLLRPRILSYDSTFGLEATTAITVHKDSKPMTIPSKPAVPVFDDTQTWWFNSDEHGSTGSHPGRFQPGWYSVNVPETGTQIRVKSVDGKGFMNVSVGPSE